MSVRLLSILLMAAAVALACETAVASPASSLLKALARYFSKEAITESTEVITKEVSQEVVERVAQRVVREGGETQLELLTAMVAKHGPDIVRAMDNAPDPVRVLKALDELPADDVSKAAARLAAGESGKQLAETTSRFGAAALRAEVKHPGVGSRYVVAWGNDGDSLCTSLTNERAILLGKYIDDIAQVPATQRNQLLATIRNDSDRFFQWLGRFIDKNPGKTIGSATFLAVFLPNSERILGGDEIVFDKDGNPMIVRRPGLLGDPANQVADAVSDSIRFSGTALTIVAAAAVVLIVLRWQFAVWRTKKSKAEVVG